MSDQRFIIEILLDARNQIGGALEAAGAEVEKLQKKFDGASGSAQVLDGRLEKLDRGVGKAAGTFRSINPTLEAFNRRLERIVPSSNGVANGLEKMFRRLEKVNLGLESTIKTINRAERVITKLEARLDELGLRKVEPTVDVKISRDNLDVFLLELQKLEHKSYTAKTNIETRVAEAELEKLREKLRRAGFGSEADLQLLHIQLSREGDVATKLEALQHQANKLNEKHDIKVALQGEKEVKAQINELIAELRTKKSEDFGIKAFLQREQFDREYDRILADIAILSGSTASPSVKLNKKQYEAEKAILLADLAHLGLKTETISVSLDVKKDFGDRLASIGEQIDSTIGDRGALTARKLVNAFINAAVLFSEPLLSAITAVGGSLVALGAAALQAGAGIAGLASAAGAQAIPVLGELALTVQRVTAVAKAVGLAYKQQQQAGQQQLSLDQARASAADAIKNAEEGVANAQRAVITAQLALNKARADGVRQIEDLVLAEARARRAAEGSQQGLSAAIATGTGSVIDAQLQAQGDQVQASRATVDAKTAVGGGIEGLASVIAAKTQLADATRGVASAQRGLVAAERQADTASQRLIRSANAFEMAYGQLSKGEKQLFSVLHNENNTGLLDLFQNDLDGPIRKTTDIILVSVSHLAKSLISILTDPAIVKTFQGLAHQIGGVVDDIAKALKTGPVRAAIIFFTGEAAKNIKPVAGIFGDLLRIFFAIAHAASGPLGDAIQSVSKYFDHLADRAEDGARKGTLGKFFEDAMKPIGAFLDLGGAVINLFLALIGPGGAADAGTSGIEGLTASINRATEYINKHSKAVSQFFKDAVKATGDVYDVLIGIGKLLVNTFDPKSVKAFADLLNNTLFPAVGALLGVLGHLVKGLIAVSQAPVIGPLVRWGLILGGTTLIVSRFIEFFGGFLKLFASTGTIRTFARTIGNTRLVQLLWNSAIIQSIRFQALLAAEWIKTRAAAIANAAATRVSAAAQAVWSTVTRGASAAASALTVTSLRQRAAIIASSIAARVAAVATGALTAAQWLLNIALNANPIGLAVIAIAALVGGFILAYKHIKPFHNAVDSVFNFIKKHWPLLVEIMLGPLGLVIAGVRAFGPRVLRWIKGAFNDVKDFFADLPGKLASAFSDGFHSIGHVFESIGSRIVKAIIRGVKSAPKALLNALKGLLPSGLKGAANAVLSVVPGIATGARIAGNPADGDSVHVRVKPGEIIANETQQRSLGLDNVARAMAGAPQISAGGGYATGGGTPKQSRTVSTGPAILALAKLAATETDDIADDFARMRKRITRTMAGLNDDATSSWREFWKAGDRNLGRLEDSITTSFRNIGDTVYKGISYISDASGKALKSLGGKPADFNLTRLSLGGERHAGGGMVGLQGERGKDLVHTVLGRGEAVLNWAHQRVVEPAMQKMYGFGLQGMFKRTNAQHAAGGEGFAGGGFAGGAPEFNGHPSNINPNLARVLVGLERRFPTMVVTSTTDHSTLTTSGNRSDHVDGNAFDFSGDKETMNRAARYVISSGLAKKLKQAIYQGDPSLTYSGGQNVGAGYFGPAVMAQHANHLHIALVNAIGRLAGSVSTKLRRQRVDGSAASVLASIASRSIDSVRKSAQRVIDDRADPGRHDGSDIRVLAAAGGRRVGATTFGGPGDPGTGVTGYRGDNLHQYPNSFAELSNPGTLDFAALGGLPYKTRLRITAPTGKSAIALKRDVGKGGPAVGGVKRGIDLWYELAEKLGLGGVWSGVVKIARAATGGFVGDAIQQFASGGIVNGALGKAVPIVAHAGEWVLNKVQQAQLASMMGHSVGKLKDRLGFTGGPTHFAGGGLVGAPRENKDTGDVDLKKMLIGLAIPYGFVGSMIATGIISSILKARKPLLEDPFGPGGLDKGMITEYEAFGSKRVGVVTGFNKISGDPYIKEAGKDRTTLISRSSVFPESSALSKTTNAYTYAELLAQLAREPKLLAEQLKAERKQQRAFRRANRSGVEIYRGTPNTDPGKFELYSDGTGIRGPGTHASSDYGLARSYADPQGGFSYKKNTPGNGYIYSTKLNLGAKGISWDAAERLPRLDQTNVTGGYGKKETVTEAARRHGYDFMEKGLYQNGGRNSDIILLTEKAIAQQQSILASAVGKFVATNNAALRKITKPITDANYQRYLKKTYPKTLQSLGSEKPGHFGYDNKKIERIEHVPGTDEIRIYSVGNERPDHAYAVDGEGSGPRAPKERIPLGQRIENFRNRTDTKAINSLYPETLKNLGVTAENIKAIEHVPAGSRRILVHLRDKDTPIKAYAFEDEGHGLGKIISPKAAPDLLEGELGVATNFKTSAVDRFKAQQAKYKAQDFGYDLFDRAMEKSGALRRVARFAAPALNKVFAGLAIKDLLAGKFASALTQGAGFIPGPAGLFASALLAAALKNNKNLPTRGRGRAELDKQNYDSGRTGPALGGRLQHAAAPEYHPTPVTREDAEQRGRLLRRRIKKAGRREVNPGGRRQGLAWGGYQATGGHYIVRKPTAFIAGEAGPEIAAFTPIAKVSRVAVDPPPTATQTPRLNTNIRAPAATTTAPTTSSNSGGSSGGGSGSTASAASKAAEKIKKKFEKLYDDAVKAIDKAIEESRFDNPAPIRKATLKIARSFRKIATKGGDALDALSRLIDNVLTDSTGALALVKAANQARTVGRAIRLKTSQFGQKDGGTRTARSADSIGRQTIADLRSDRTDLRGEDKIAAQIQRDARAGLNAAEDAQDKAEKKLKAAKNKKDKDKAKAEIEEAKKRVQTFRGELNKANATRQDIRGRLADNAQQVVEAREQLARDSFDASNSFFGRLKAGLDRAKRILVARGKSDGADNFDAQTVNAQAQVEDLRKRLAIVKKTQPNNTKLIQDIEDGIAELGATIEEIAAAKFQAAVELVNKNADRSLSANDFQQKLASAGIGVTAGAGGVNIQSVAQLGRTNFSAQGEALSQRGDILKNQRAGIAELLAQAQAAGNSDQVDALTKQLQALDGSIVDNITAIRDNTQAALNDATSRRQSGSNFFLGLNQAASGISSTIASITGTPDTNAQRGFLTQRGTLLGTATAADKADFAKQANTISPGLVDANKLASLAPQDVPAYLSSVVGYALAHPELFSDGQVDALEGLANNIVGDIQATQDNTLALKNLSNDVSQTFQSTAWQIFRNPIFNGSNGLLPGFINPQISANGSLATTPPNATTTVRSSVDKGDINVDVNITSPTEVADPVAIGNRVAFEVAHVR